MEIRVDTSLMQLMANTTLRAKDSVEEAREASNVVTVHNDWNCAERDYINDAILEVKKKNGIICENMSMFASKVNEIAAKFEEFDRLLASQYSSFDAAIGELHRIESPVVTGSTQIHSFEKSELEKILTPIGENNYWNRYHVSNLTEPVSVIGFSDAKGILDGSQSLE